MVWWGNMRQDQTRLGRPDQTRQDETRQDKTRQDKTRQDKTRQDKTRQHKTRQHKTTQDNTRQHKTWQDNTRYDMTWLVHKRNKKEWSSILPAPLVSLTLFFFPPHNSIFFLLKHLLWLAFDFCYCLIFGCIFFLFFAQKPGKPFYTFFFFSVGVGSLRVAGATDNQVERGRR